MKTTFCIIHEPITKKLLLELQSIINKYNFLLTIRTLSYFPTGDSMLPFLFGLSKNFNFSLILIANNTKGYFWISQELKRQHIMGNYHNIYPVFSSQADVPVWWNDGNQKFVTMDNLIVLDKILDLS